MGEILPFTLHQVERTISLFCKLTTTHLSHKKNKDFAIRNTFSCIAGQILKKSALLFEGYSSIDCKSKNKTFES